MSDVSIPLKPQPPEKPAVDATEEHVYGRSHQQVVEWRAMWLQKAGWTEDRALYIAYLTMNDLIDMGYSDTEAARAYPDFWRLACKAIECGDEVRALYILGLSSER